MPAFYLIQCNAGHYCMPATRKLFEHTPGFSIVHRLSEKASVQHHNGIRAYYQTRFLLTCNGDNFSACNTCDIIRRCLIRVRPLLNLTGYELEFDPDLA